MGFRLQQTLMILSELERQFTAVIRIMHVLTEWLRLESRGFCYKVALCLSYLHIKFDDETKANHFKLHAYFPIRLHPKLS